MIELEALTKRYRRTVALDGLDLQVPPGTAAALVGPNGAGKTTLLRILATLERPTAGTARIQGHDVLRDGPTARAHLGYAGHAPGLAPGLTPRELLHAVARLHGLDRADADARVRELLRVLDLTDRADDRGGDLSHGLRRRVGLARALVHDPPVLLLDEPFAGLDPEAAGRLHRVLRDTMDGDRTLLAATHDPRRAAALAHRVLVLRRGRLAAEVPGGDPDAVLHHLDPAREDAP